MLELISNIIQYVPYLKMVNKSIAFVKLTIIVKLMNLITILNSVSQSSM